MAWVFSCWLFWLFLNVRWYNSLIFSLLFNPLLVYLRADVMVVGERTIVNCKFNTKKKKPSSNNTNNSNPRHRSDLFVYIHRRLCRHHAQQPSHSNDIQFTFMAQFRYDCCHWLHRLSTKQMEFGRQTLLSMALWFGCRWKSTHPSQRTYFYFYLYTINSFFSCIASLLWL